jgi:hypothetical protein
MPDASALARLRDDDVSDRCVPLSPAPAHPDAHDAAVALRHDTFAEAKDLFPVGRPG